MGPVLLRIVILCYCLAASAHHALGADLLIIESEEGAPYTTISKAILSELSRLGFIEGQNLQVKYWSLGNSEGMARRAWMEEKDNHYDVIFLNGTVAALNFYKFEGPSSKNKFVFGAVTDPIGIGIIDEFNTAPTSNITGICYPIKIEERLRFLQRTMPEARDIGFVYSDMVQSLSYQQWLEKALITDEFKHLRFHFRKVPFVKGEEGHVRMTRLAKQFIEELDPKVDLFLSPNDQMGVQQPFAQMVWQTATKPLIGLGRLDVMEGWGATMSIFPSLTETGKRLALMISDILTGTPVNQLPPQWPESGMAFDLQKTRRFNISIPDEMLLTAGANIIY